MNEVLNYCGDNAHYNSARRFVGAAIKVMVLAKALKTAGSWVTLLLP
jgi:hypothetical protein